MTMTLPRQHKYVTNMTLQIYYLWQFKLSWQRQVMMYSFMSRCHYQDISKNVIIEQMTLNNSCHKHVW